MEHKAKHDFFYGPYAETLENAKEINKARTKL